MVARPAGVAANVRQEVAARIGAIPQPFAETPNCWTTYAAWDDLIARIRKVSGFEDFLRPPDSRVLARQAAVGPVIFPYASQAGCGALILTDRPDTPVMAVPFDVTEQEAFRQAERLADALGEGDDAIRPAGARVGRAFCYAPP